MSRCVMANCFSTIFKDNAGKEIFKILLKVYFDAEGLQHRP